MITSGTGAHVRRVLAASPERVFNAFADAQLVARWLRPSPEIKLSVLAFEFRVGGAYRFAYDVPTGERMVVGRLNSCDVCLSDSNASRQHAAFVPEGAGWAIEDLGSTNGTWVNGQRVERLRLRDGDVVVVGVTELVYHEPRS